MTPERIAEIETALEAGDELDPTVVVELLSAVKEARRSGAGRVGAILSEGVLADLGRRHFGNPIPQEWYRAAHELVGLVTSRLSPSPQPSADVVMVPRDLLVGIEDALGHAQGLGPCGLGLLCQVQALIEPPTPEGGR